MLLKECLSKLPEDARVKIGFNNGTGFVYAGKTFDGFNVLLQEISYKEREWHINKKEALEKKLNGEINADIVKRIIGVFSGQLLDSMKTMNSETDEFPKKVAANFYECCEECRKSEWKKVRAAHKAVCIDLKHDPYGILSRDVIDVYDSVDEENVKIVIVEGDWVGKYWTCKECDEDDDMQKNVKSASAKKAMYKKR